MKAYESMLALSGHPSIEAFISENQPAFNDGVRRDSDSTTATGVCEIPDLLHQSQTISSKQCGQCFEKKSSLDLYKSEDQNQLSQFRTDATPGNQASETSYSSSHNMIETPLRRQTYDRVDTNKRRLLLQLVDQEGETIKKASQRVGINYSTAKTILQLYRRSGRIQRLPHHKTSKAKQNLKIKIFKPSAADQVEIRAKIVKKEKDPFMKASVSQKAESEASFCTNLLMEIADGKKTQDLISPLVPKDFFQQKKSKGSQSQFK